MISLGYIPVRWSGLCGNTDSVIGKTKFVVRERNTDLRYKYFKLVDGSDRHDAAVEGGFMATDKLKVTYEVHYWETYVTGRSEHGLKSLSLKGIYFPKDGDWGTWKYRLALGLEKNW